MLLLELVVVVPALHRNAEAEFDVKIYVDEILNSEACERENESRSLKLIATFLQLWITSICLVIVAEYDACLMTIVVD